MTTKIKKIANRVGRFLFGWIFRILLRFMGIEVRTEDYGGPAMRMMVVVVRVPYSRKVNVFKIKASGIISTDSHVKSWIEED